MPDGMSTVTLAGTEGTLRIGGRRAAVLGRWRLDGDVDGWSIEADVIACDEYWIDQGGPFELRIPWGSNLARWRPVTLMAFIAPTGG